MALSILEDYWISSKRKDLKNLRDVLTVLYTLISDLETTCRIQENYMTRRLAKEANPEKVMEPRDHGVVTFNYLILTLHKYIELYKERKFVLNKFIKSELPKKLSKELTNLGVKDLRNKYAGHAFDDKTGSPLTHEEFLDFLKKIMLRRKSLYAFFQEIHAYPFIEGKSIVSILNAMATELESSIEKIKIELSSMVKK